MKALECMEDNAWKIIKTEKHCEHDGVHILCKYCLTYTKSIMTENILQTGLSNLHCCVRRVKNKLNQLIMFACNQQCLFR